MSGPSPVTRDKLGFDDDRRATLAGAPFTGVAADDRPDGSRLELPYVDGLIEGVSREMRPSGALHETATYWFGALHGHSRRWDDDGTLVVEEVHEFGVLTDRRVFGADGRVASHWRIGPGDDLYSVLELSRARYGSTAPDVSA